MFNIQTLKNASLDLLMFPKEILDEQISFLYDFTKQREYSKNQWEQLINNWREERIQREVEAVKTHTDIDRYIFYYVDGGTFLKIYDKRNQQELRIFVLDQTEREIFLGCIDVISYDQLTKQFAHIPDFKLAAILETLESNGIVYQEDNHYLSLPLQLKKLHQITKKEMLEPIAQLT